MSLPLGTDVVYHWWGCATLEAAWMEAGSGNVDAADALAQRVSHAMTEHPEEFRQWERARSIDWTSARERDGGMSGLCDAWFERG